MKLGKTLIIASLCYSTQCFAIFCPNNFNLIDFGNTTAQVEAQCGKPTSKKTYKTEDNMPQEWTYYMPISSSYVPFATGNTQGTMKVTFAFVNNKATNITSNGIGVGATTICNNVNLQLESTVQDVKKACGSPQEITKTNQNDPTTGLPPLPIQMEDWTYQGSPTVTLVFQNGTLKDRK